MTVMMKCGHAANATDKDGKPVCVICISIAPGADEVDTDGPNLEGRFAKCAYNSGDPEKHKNEPIPSNINLAFFEYRGPESPDALTMCRNCGYYETGHKTIYEDPNTGMHHKDHVNCVHCVHFTPHGPYEFDRYYCGCRGWD